MPLPDFLKPLFQLFHRDKDNSPGPTSSVAALLLHSQNGGTVPRGQEELSTYRRARGRGRCSVLATHPQRQE